MSIENQIRKEDQGMKKVIIGFETSTEFKQRVIEAGLNYKIDGVDNPVNLSMFCRIAVAKLLNQIEEEERSNI